MKKTLWLVLVMTGTCYALKAQNKNSAVMVYTEVATTPFDTIVNELNKEKSIIQKSLKIHTIVDEVEQGKRPELKPFLADLKKLKRKIVDEFHEIAVQEAEKRRRAREAAGN